MKNQFSDEVIELLASAFLAAWQDFDSRRFSSALSNGFPALELKDRINLVADTLHAELPDDYPTALDTVVSVAEAGVEGFAAWPLCSFVERHGLDHPKESLDAMHSLTQQFSCEFAIRPFLDRHLEATLERLRAWTADPEETVRRLPSEGTRPILPWGPKVQVLSDDPSIGIDLIGDLCLDPSEVVRRSVANHLNDVAKTDADLVVATLRKWTKLHPEIEPSLVRHALRSLVKAGHPAALQLLGFTTDAKIDVTQFACEPSTISLGQQIELTAVIASAGELDQLLVVDFIVHHVSASGSTSPKVFKWTTVGIAPADSVTLTKRRTIATASTRKYHAGSHRVDLQVAGVVVATTQFELRDSS